MTPSRPTSPEPPAPPPPPPAIRAVTADDVPRVVDLVRRVLAEFGLSFGDGSATDQQLYGLPGSYTADGLGAFYVAEDPGGRLLGTAGVAALDAETFELRKMYLEPAARGTGLGRLLLERALAHVRGSGGRRVVLDTTDQMVAAIRFYERHGFRRDDAWIRGARCSRGYVLDLDLAPFLGILEGEIEVVGDLETTGCRWDASEGRLGPTGPRS